jgi:uncharacterized phage-associated protein
MAFLLPVGELVLNAVEAGVAGNMVNAVYNEFKEPVKQVLTEKAGKVVGDYAKANPDGYVDNIVEQAYIQKKRRVPVRKVGR